MKLIKKLPDFKSDIMEEISAFSISDSTRRLRGIGTDADCLNAILNFINSSGDKDSISASWTWFEKMSDEHYSKVSFTSDLVVNIYGPDELDEPVTRENRTCSNWGYANKKILDALYN